MLRQLNIMIHRLEQDGYVSGSESVQVVFLYCLYLHHIELPFNIKRGLGIQFTGKLERCGRDRKVDGFTTTCANNAYHH